MGQIHVEGLGIVEIAGDTPTPEESAAIAGAMQNAPPQAPSVGPKPGSAGEYATGFAGGFNVGLAEMAGLPVDLMNWGLSHVGLGSEKPVMGSRWIKEGVESVSPEMFARGPDDTLGRVINRVGEEIGASVLPAAGIAGAALKRGVPAVAGASRSLPGAVADTVVNPVAKAPLAMAGAELGAATGAGVGAGIAQEVAPGNVAAEMTGQMVGALLPTAGSYMPSALGARLVRKAHEAFSPEAQSKKAAQEVKKVIGGEMTNEAVKNLQEAEQLRQRMPGFNPTLGEATGAPGLVATQRQIERSAEGPDLDRLAARRRDSERAIESFAEREAPKGTGGPDYVIDTANQRIEVLRGEVAKTAEEVAAERGRVAEGLPMARRDVAGQTLRDRLLAARSETQERMSQLANELGISTADITVPFAKAAKDLVKEFDPKSVFDDLSNYPTVMTAIQGATKAKPPIDTGVLDELGRPIKRAQPGKPITFQDLKALRERVSDDLIDAIGSSNPSRKKIRQLTLLKNRVDDFIDELTQDADPELASRYKQFRDAYRTDYIERFEKGAAFKVRQADGRGFYRTPDERVAEAFFQPGNVSAAKQFHAAYQGDAEALAALEAVALDSLRDASVRNGSLDRGLMDRWVRRHQSVLDEFPEIRAKVEKLDAADKSLFERQAQLTERAKAIEDQVLTRELNAFARTTKTGGDVVQAALNDPRKMTQLMSVLKGRPDALASLRRNVWQQAASGSSEDILRFIGDNEQSLKLLFRENPQHLKDLADITAARTMLERLPPPTGAPYTPRPLANVEKMIGQGIPQLASRGFAFQTGRVQKGYLLVDTFMRGLRGRAQQSAEDLFREALYDPVVAKEFVNALETGQLTPRMEYRLHNRLVALGMTAPRATAVVGTAVREDD